MTHLFDQFIRAVHFPQKPAKKPSQETRLQSYLRAAASRGAIGSGGVPLHSFTAQALLDAAGPSHRLHHKNDNR